MKNLIKLLSVLSITSFSLFIVASAAYTGTLSIKKLWNESFSDKATLNSTWDEFIMNISLVPLYDKKTRVDITGLPAWITPKSFEIDGATCWEDINNISYNQTANTLFFTYTPTSNSICVITTHYTTSGVAAWDYIVKPTLTDSVDNVFDNWNDVITDWNNIDIKISSLVQITEADSLDSNNNWFLDGYKLTFNKVPWAALLPSQVEIRTEDNIAANLAYNNATQIITFDDNVFTTWEKPLIEVTNTSGGYEAMKYNVSIHNDTAAPYITSVSSPINSDDNITLVFNEKMKTESMTNLWNLTWWTRYPSFSSSYDSNTNTLTINPSESLYPWATYTLSLNNNPTDWEDNKMNARSFNISIIKPAWWGGWWWGWGGWSHKNYESKDFFYNKEIKLSEAINQDKKVFWKVKIIGNTSLLSTITKTGETIRLYWNSKQESNLLIYENTTVSYSKKFDSLMYPFLKYEFDEPKVRAQNYLDLNWKQIKTYNADTIWFVWSEKSLLTLNKDATVNIKLERAYQDDEYYVFYNDSLDWTWSPVNNNPFSPNKDWIISVKTDKLGYIVVVRDRYYTWKTSSWTTSSKYATLDEARKAILSDTSNTLLPKFVNAYYDYLYLNNLDYFTTFDTKLKTENDKLINAYYKTFTWIDKYLAWNKDKTFVSTLMKSVTLVDSEKKRRKWLRLEERYIDRVVEIDDSVIYRVKEEKYKAAFKSLENQFVGKLRLLRDNENIEEEEYQTALSAYNNLVLNFAIYKQFNELPEALNRAMEAVKTLNKTYTKKVVYKPAIIEEPQILLVKDVYTLTKTLKLWDYNDDVRNLQAIMRMYGHFDYPSNTWYFWNVTRNALIKFAKAELDYTSTWVLDNTLREKILNLEIKE